jgi:two-component system cell cycle response regulator DivK
MRERRASRPLVLIADDSIDVREMYEEYLNAVGYRVVTASNGREAVIFARVSRPDVVVMDLQMPNVDGWAAIRELQHDAKTASLPVIALTGHDLKDHLKYSAMAEGAVSYLTKPIIPEHLVREIAVCLEQSRMKQRRAV